MSAGKPKTKSSQSGNPIAFIQGYLDNAAHPFFQSAQRLFKKTVPLEKTEMTMANIEEKTRLIGEKDNEADVPQKLPTAVEKRYRVRRVLGKGAFGIVYLAEDRRIGRLVAVKQLLTSFAKDPEIYDRFTQEARIGAQLDHPNIVNVLSLEEDESSACIIMEYLGGGSLASYLHKEGRLDFGTAARIILGVLNGLDAAHHIMVIHRDIKPQNILFSPRGEPKISDFGVAHLPIRAGGIPKISDDMMKIIIGTPIYMAPEQIMKKLVDCRADLYSAGAVLYEMLTGKRIFAVGSSDTMDMKNMVVYQPPDPVDPSLKIPEGLVNITLKLLAKNPDDRFSDARSVMDAIQEVVSESEVKEGKLNSDARIGRIGPLLSSPAAMLEDVIRLFLVDGSLLSPAERKELKMRAERLGVSKIQAEAIEEKVRAELKITSLAVIKQYAILVEAFVSLGQDCVLTKDQQEYLGRKRKELNLSDNEGAIIERECRERIRYQKRVVMKK